jgi:hypothetical protein
LHEYTRNLYKRATVDFEALYRVEKIVPAHKGGRGDRDLNYKKGLPGKKTMKALPAIKQRKPLWFNYLWLQR